MFTAKEPKPLFANGEIVYLKKDNNISQVVDNNTKDWSLWESLPKQELNQTKKPNTMFTTKVKETAAAKKSDKKLFSALELEGKISQFTALKNQIDTLTGQLKMIEGEVKERAKIEFFTQYRKERRKPDNFKLQDAEGGQVMAIFMDKYGVVDSDKAAALKPYNLVIEKKVFKFNNDLLEKYQDTITELLSNSPDIDAEDKANLIEGELTYHVEQGAIEKLFAFPNIEEVFELIKPVIALKK